MIRVLHIAPGIDGGGVGGVIYSYLSNMDRSDMYIELCVRDYGRKHLLHDRFEEMGIPVHYVTQRKTSIKKHFSEVKKILEEGHFDIVHCHDQNWSFAYLKMAAKAGVPVRIAHSHLTMQTSGKIKIMVLNCFQPMLKKTATGYFGCGLEAGRYMWGNKIVDSGQLYVMNNAVDVKKYAYDVQKAEQLKKQFGLGPDQTVIGHIGRFSEQKNHVFLLKIFKAYLNLNSNAVLVLIGIGELEDKIKQLAKTEGIAQNILFLGQRSDAAELYNLFDLFILPSLYEGLPVVGVESQVNGLPCLFSDTVSSEVCILPGTTMMSLKQPPEEWAEQMQKMLQNKGEHREDTLQYVNQKGFNIETEAERLKQYYVNEVKKRKK